MRMLALTLGTNPLPCVVAWRALIADGQVPDRVVLFSGVGKEGTASDPAEAFRRYAKAADGPAIEVVRLGDPWDAGATYQKVHDSLEASIRLRQDVHLHYTGGTKQMAVQAHRAAVALGITKEKLSYLDPRTFRLRYDSGTSFPEQGDLRAKVFVRIPELLQLHNLTPLRPDKTRFARTALYLLQHLGDDRSLETYTEWVRKLKPPKGNQASVERQWPRTLPELAQLLADDAREEGIQIDAGQPLNWDHISRNGHRLSRAEQRELHTWLDGKWLESAAVQSLEPAIKALREDKIASFGMISNSRWSAGGTPMELDVLLINGYQLTGVSCTRSLDRADGGTVKHHAFEVRYRTQQLGGDEARAVLIAPRDASQQVEQDLRVFYGTRPHLRVFPIEDLLDKAKVRDLLMDWS